MKNKRLLLTYCAALSVVFFSAACEKQANEITPEKIQMEKPASPEIAKLTEFLRKTTQLKEGEITFNPKDQQFYIYGIAQISLRDLSVAYEQNNKNDK